MEYKINIFSLILVAAIATSSIFSGYAKGAFGSPMPSKEFGFQAKDHLKLEGTHIRQAAPTLIKCVLNLFSEEAPCFILFNDGRHEKLKSHLVSVFSKTFFYQNIINAP